MAFQLSLFAPPTAPPAPAECAADDVAEPSIIEPLRRRRRAPADQTLDYCVLGSGSGGNCAVVRFGEQAMLLDAGFGPLRTAKWLSNAGVQLEQVKAICVTHLDRDHSRPRWIPTLVGFGIRVYVHQWHLFTFEKTEGFADLNDAGLVHVFDGQSFEPIVGLETTCVQLPHDNKGTVGFVVDTGDTRIGHATDLGHVPPKLIEHFAGVDLLALESNYDPELQMSSARPAFLKRRIMGGKGHLSNDQALDAVQRIARRSPTGLPRHVVLLHRSSDCNSPHHVRRVFRRDPALLDRVTLTQQRRRTKWFKLSPMDAAMREQIRLDFR